MSDRRQEQEFRLGELLADELNSLRGCDYEARRPTEEPADVVLVSVSGRRKPRKVQVVGIPFDWRSRDDIPAERWLEENLPPILRTLNVDHCVVDIQLTSRGEEHKMPNAVANQLAALIRDSIPPPESRCDLSPVVAELVHSLSISSYTNSPLNVQVGKAIIVPSDGRWIEEAVRAKSKSYGPAEMKDLTLLIDAVGTADPEQIADFMKRHPEKNLPFREIWIAALGGMLCLKSSESGKSER